MKDVSAKYHSLRTARAQAVLTLSPQTIAMIRSGGVPKGDPIGVARIAAIQAAKNTSVLIPYCHQVPLDHVSIDIELHDSTISMVANVRAIWKTGVEMEALTAVSAAALTLYDMLKPIDDSMEISGISLIQKTGGKSSISETGHGLKAGVIVISDSVSRGTSEDTSGKILAERLKELGFEVADFSVVPDDSETITQKLRTSSEDRHLDLIVTTGGTGVGPRDVTPEATLAVIDRRLDGVEETLRRFGQERLPTSMLSRGIAGLCGSTLILNLPGSPGGVLDGMNAVFPSVIHVFRMMRGGGHM